MHAGPLFLVQSHHLGVVAEPDRTQRSSRSMVSTRARGTTRHLFGIHPHRRRRAVARGAALAEHAGGTQLQTGGAGWGSACGHALLSREYFLPIRSLLRRAGARSPVAVRDDVPAAAAALAAGNAECGISLHSRVRQAGSPVARNRINRQQILCLCARIRSDFCIVRISFARVNLVCKSLMRARVKLHALIT